LEIFQTINISKVLRICVPEKTKYMARKSFDKEFRSVTHVYNETFEQKYFWHAHKGTEMRQSEEACWTSGIPQGRTIEYLAG
jgi:hypothetical protein